MKKPTVSIEKSVVQYLLQRHIMLQWLEFKIEETHHMFLLHWDSNDITLERVFCREFPELKDSSREYVEYFAGLMIKNEESFLPEHFETTILYNSWSHASRKSCSVYEIRDEYIYYIRKFLLNVACVEGK